jgi:hypothetical protein
MTAEATCDTNNVPPPDDVDLYCLQCGYNLRGHSGDPRRCPECGHLNPMGDLEIPAELITKQLERMETAPTACVAAFSLVVLCTILWFYLIIGESREFLPLLCLFCTIQIFSIILWIWGINRFKAACLGRPGWFSLLVKYHIYGSILFCIIVLSFAVYIGFKLTNLYVRGLDTTELMLLIGVLAVVFLTIRIFGYRVRQNIKQDMDILQRGVAVDLARERLRQELRRKPKE